MPEGGQEARRRPTENQGVHRRLVRVSREDHHTASEQRRLRGGRPARGASPRFIRVGRISVGVIVPPNAVAVAEGRRPRVVPLHAGDD